MYTFEKFSFTAGTLHCLQLTPVLHLYKVIQCTCMTFIESGPDLLLYIYINQLLNCLKGFHSASKGTHI